MTVTQRSSRLLFVVVVVTLASCQATAAPSPTPAAGPGPIAAGQHLAVTIASPWQMGRENSVTVSVDGIDRPLILSVELEPLYAVEPILQKPVAVDGTPVAGNLEELDGFQIVQQVDGDGDVTLTFAGRTFDPELYTGRRAVDGWRMNVLLAPQIVAYPVPGGKQLGARVVILPAQLPQRPTIITSIPRGNLAAEQPEYDYFVIPGAEYGMVSYVALDSLVDAIRLESGPSFDFAQPHPGPGDHRQQEEEK